MEPTPPVEPGPSQDSSFLDSKLKAMINSPLADAVILLSLKHATHYNIGRWILIKLLSQILKYIIVLDECRYLGIT